MKYFLWLYLANIINRVRWLGILTARVSLILLVVEHLILAQPVRPDYYAQVEHYINWTWVWWLVSLLLVFIPSEGFILNTLAMYKRDSFMRESIASKVLRLVKYVIKHDLLAMPYRKSLYQRLINPQRIKWICILMYCYDLYKGFARALRDFWLVIVAYAGFIVATWLYVKLTGVQLYYYPTIDHGMGWLIALASFLIFKVIFIPSFSVIKRIAIKLFIDLLRYKFGLGNLESKLDAKLATYEKGE
ncbi:MAG: hypothetical protein EKK57_06925 [Proteobacteria bacterium]|nr:MAG: hypothetical protein EKK57_06925 [Pseudomonadota bacterium]